MGMLTATVTGPDLAEVLGPVTGRGPVIDALIDGLGPVVVRLLQVGIGLGGRAAAGTVSLGEVEQELRTSGRELIRAAMQAVMDAASAAEERRPGGVDGPDGVRRTTGGGRARPQCGDRVRADQGVPAGLPGPAGGERAPAGRGAGPACGPVLTRSGQAVRPGIGPGLVHRRRRRRRVRHRGPDRHPADHRTDPGRSSRRDRLLRRPRPRGVRRRPGRRTGDHRGRQGRPGPTRGPAPRHRQARHQGQDVSYGRQQRAAAAAAASPTASGWPNWSASTT